MNTLKGRPQEAAVVSKQFKKSVKVSNVNFYHINDNIHINWFVSHLCQKQIFIMCSPENWKRIFQKISKYLELTQIYIKSKNQNNSLMILTLKTWILRVTKHLTFNNYTSEMVKSTLSCLRNAGIIVEVYFQSPQKNFFFPSFPYFLKFWFYWKPTS